jgi:hypothetical protein
VANAVMIVASPKYPYSVHGHRRTSSAVDMKGKHASSAFPKDLLTIVLDIAG